MKVKRIRIYLGHNNETKNAFLKGDVINFFNEYLEGYTIIKTDGLYKGTMEESYVIEYLQMGFAQYDRYMSEIGFYKNMIKDAEKYFQQESILWTIDEVEMM